MLPRYKFSLLLVYRKPQTRIYLGQQKERSLRVFFLASQQLSSLPPSPSPSLQSLPITHHPSPPSPSQPCCRATIDAKMAYYSDFSYLSKRNRVALSLARSLHLSPS